MADLNNAQQLENITATAIAQPKEQYKGTGKVVSALGGASVGGFFGSLGSGVVLLLGGGITIIKNAFNDSKKTSNTEFGTGFVVTAAIAALLPTIGSIVGAVKGWKHASQGKKQFEEAQQKAQISEQMIGSLAYQAADLKQERDTLSLGLNTMRDTLNGKNHQPPHTTIHASSVEHETSYHKTHGEHHADAAHHKDGHASEHHEKTSHAETHQPKSSHAENVLASQEAASEHTL